MEVHEWHVVISGFQQRSGTLNGCVQIWGDLIHLTRDRPAARVELLTWNSDFADLAERISRIAAPGQNPLVNVYGYSWGGMSAAIFARELRRRGVDVAQMVLSDAVYRHWYTLGQWRAFVPGIAIRIPDNVREVTYFIQRESWPRGHRIIADNPGRTKIHPAIKLKTDHCWMDDQSAFRFACRKAAGQLKV